MHLLPQLMEQLQYFYSMKKLDKNLSLQDENQLFRQTSRGKHLKFQRIKKESSTLPINYNINQPIQNTNRKYVYDQQTMNDMIIALKEQNNQLKNIIKIQQTQISYFQQQQRNLIINSSNSANKGLNSENKQQIPNSHHKKIELQNFRLKKDVQKLAEQINKIKKTIKHTNIKQLQTQIYVYELEIKNLTAKLTAFKKSTTNIEQINLIIQKQYFSGLKIKELQSIIDNKSKELQQSGKIIRKLKNIICQKNNQIQNFKQEKQKIQNIFTKNKNNEQYVPKSQLITKKKQLLAMTQTIQKLQLKLFQCEAKAQALQQENIDNMNRQTNKRKQILNQFQKLKKLHESLKKDLSNSSKINNELPDPIRITKVPNADNLFRKPRIPQVVKLELIKQTIQLIIFNLQKNNIDHKSALSLIKCSSKQNQEVPLISSQTPEQQINIRQIIQCLQQFPFNLQNYDQKQLLARYLVQSESDNNQTINFDSLVNLSYVRSVFKLLLQQYPLFNQYQISEICLIVQDLLKRNEHTLKNTLHKLQLQKPNKNLQQKGVELSTSSVNSINKRKIGAYRCYDYVEAIIRQNQITDDILKFLKYWTFQQKEQYLTYKEFTDYFKVEGVCTFITEDPDNYISTQQKNQIDFQKQSKNIQQTNQQHRNQTEIN